MNVMSLDNHRIAGSIATAGGVALLLTLPLVGVTWTGHPVRQYLEFPPLTSYVTPAPFAWPAFIGLATLNVICLAPFLWRVVRHTPPTSPLPPTTSPLPPSTFPPWAWFGLLLGLVAWVLAWTRFPWFARFQVFTFSPLWFAYILVVNGLTLRRSGRCMLTHQPRTFCLLFPLSAAFWWFFEYLNRFVQNWHYVGIGALTPADYVLFATLPFATVLPAVLGTHELLATFPRLTAGLDRFAPLAPRRPRILAALALGVAAAGLALVGVRPDYLFPLLWVSPLVILTALQTLAGRPTLFAPLARGDWQRVWRLALSALICGFFWEMWNCGSLARWVYAVPFVHRFQIFEMPLLGYAGYLPFGLECAVIAEIVFGVQNSGFREDLNPWPPNPEP